MNEPMQAMAEQKHPPSAKEQIDQILEHAEISEYSMSLVRVRKLRAYIALLQQQATKTKNQRENLKLLNRAQRMAQLELRWLRAAIREGGPMDWMRLMEQARQSLWSIFRAEQAEDKNSPQSQINKLATFILAEVPGEPSRSEGALDTIIRWVKNVKNIHGPDPLQYDGVLERRIQDLLVTLQSGVEKLAGSIVGGQKLSHEQVLEAAYREIQEQRSKIADLEMPHPEAAWDEATVNTKFNDLVALQSKVEEFSTFVEGAGKLTHVQLLDKIIELLPKVLAQPVDQKDCVFESGKKEGKMYPSQMDQMREFIRTDALLRLVLPHFVEGKNGWKCGLCGTHTPLSNQVTSSLMAKHTTFCKLGKVLVVVE